MNRQDSLHILRGVLGAHPPLVNLLRTGARAGSSALEFDTSYSPTNRAFRDMAEFQRFDFSELALGTYVQARAAGKPITLLPVSLVSRFQHDQLVFDSARGHLEPEDLEGRTVAVRSYSQTTGVWVRAILRRQFGVDASKISWLVFEDAHVRGVPAPSNVRMIDGDLDDVFSRGDADAAIGATPTTTTRSIIDPAADLARTWYDQQGTVTVNHVVAVREELLDERYADVEALYDLLKGLCEGHPARQAPPGEAWRWARGIDVYPVGHKRLEPALELIAEELYLQGIIAERLTSDALTHPASRRWN